MLAVLAPAKLNLTLEVLGKRPDGYHEIRSVMQTINICDRLSFQPGLSVSYKSSSPDWNPEKSLVSHAVNLLQETAGCSRGAEITVEKQIPLVAGLGGDSSDAAAVLRGLNQLWKLGLSRRDLLESATKLGSDVPFFLYGGTALAEGRGEIINSLPPLPHHWVVLVVPDVPRLPEKTRQLYASLKPGHFTDGHITQQVIDELKAGREFTPSLLFNTFENIAFTKLSQLKVYRDHMVKLGAREVHLAGSGPALFSLIKDRAQAEDLYTRCKNQGMEVYLGETTTGIE